MFYDDYISLTWNKQPINWKYVKTSPEKLRNGLLPSICGFVLSIAPPSLSCDEKSKMKPTRKDLSS